MQKFKKELGLRDSQVLHPMAMHSLSLHLGTSSWRWYLDDIRKTILQFVSIHSPSIDKVAAYTVNGKTEKASYSSVSFREGDYDTDFSDAQRLQTLCDKMTLATSILDADMDIAQAIKSQCRDLRRLKHPNLPDENSTLTNVNLDIQRLKGFKRQAVALRAQARGTSQLASRSPALAHRSHLLIHIPQLIQLLSYRRADTLNAHAKALRGLTATSTAQSASLRDLTEKTRMDSRCMRILTFIALLYLPANLIAVRGEPNPQLTSKLYDH